MLQQRIQRHQHQAAHRTAGQQQRQGDPQAELHSASRAVQAQPDAEDQRPWRRERIQRPAAAAPATTPMATTACRKRPGARAGPEVLRPIAAR